MSNHVNILILGHSFTKRLQRWCFASNNFNLNFDSDRCQVFWHGISGGKIFSKSHPKSLWTDAYLIKDLDIDIVLLDIGGNDLSSGTVEPTALVDIMMDFARQLLQNGAKVILFSEITHRSQGERYNNRVDSTNQLLKAACSNCINIKFWSHSRNNYNKRFLRDYVASDGVHVSHRGMPRYYISVRGAIILGRNVLRNID